MCVPARAHVSGRQRNVFRPQEFIQSSFTELNRQGLSIQISNFPTSNELSYIGIDVMNKSPNVQVFISVIVKFFRLLQSLIRCEWYQYGKQDLFDWILAFLYWRNFNWNQFKVISSVMNKKHSEYLHWGGKGLALQHKRIKHLYFMKKLKLFHGILLSVPWVLVNNLFLFSRCLETEYTLL